MEAQGIESLVPDAYQIRQREDKVSKVFRNDYAILIEHVAIYGSCWDQGYEQVLFSKAPQDNKQSN